ncbi:hypothetical protein ABZS71_25615 [Streptomyces sp. NPDC005393]|uniref:hypothetical protein n=1 Tax=Streptomyces sp. NPDC005393 TaxID=3157041 RepID=UPI0033B15C08
MRAIQRARLAALAVAALAVPTGLVAATAGPAQAAATAGPAQAALFGCSTGYACIYPTTAWTTPEHTYYNYGTYKLYNEYGTHRVFNNQTGSAIMWLCTDSYGNSCPHYIPPTYYYDVDLTPYNSIKLTSGL